MASESFSLAIDLNKVADLESKRVSKTWFFLILKPVDEVADTLKHLVQVPDHRVKFLCFAEETTAEGQAVTIGYLEFIHNRGLSGIKSYPGLDMALLAQRRIDAITPDQSVSFIKGNFQMSIGQYKPLNTKFWANLEERARQRGRKRLNKKVVVDEEEKQKAGPTLLPNTFQPQDWLKQLLVKTEAKV